MITYASLTKGIDELKEHIDWLKENAEYDIWSLDKRNDFLCEADKLDKILNTMITE